MPNRIMVELKRKEARTDIASRFVVYLGKDGSQTTTEWNEPFDGPWPYGDFETKIVDNR